MYFASVSSRCYTISSATNYKGAMEATTVTEKDGTDEFAALSIKVLTVLGNKTPVNQQNVASALDTLIANATPAAASLMRKVRDAVPMSRLRDQVRMHHCFPFISKTQIPFG